MFIFITIIKISSNITSTKVDMYQEYLKKKIPVLRNALEIPTGLIITNKLFKIAFNKVYFLFLIQGKFVFRINELKI
jgi:hypothetical protein